MQLAAQRQDLVVRSSRRMLPTAGRNAAGRKVNGVEALPLDSAIQPASRPFLKWAGGKTRLLPRLLPYVPTKFRNYHEPFLGGGAMFFATRERAAGIQYLSDLNDELINTWLVLRDRTEALSRELENYRRRDSKSFYLRVRRQQPADDVGRAARFLYLNQTSWNGLWRVNKWGEFNVPWGQRSFRGFTVDEVHAIKVALTGAHIAYVDFREALERARRGDFVYLDPPYLPLSDTSKFYLYTEKRFREPDLRELAGICEDLTRRGVTWLLSNRDTSLVRELFDHAEIVGLTARRSVAAQNRRDVEAVESPEVIVVGNARP